MSRITPLLGFWLTYQLRREWWLWASILQVPVAYTQEYGSKFTLAPKFSKAFSTSVPPMLTAMVGQPGSLYLTGDLLWMIALTYSVRNTFFVTCSPLLTMHKSFRNFAYVGTCLIISSKGIFTFTCLKTSRISDEFLIPFFPCKA